MLLTTNASLIPETIVSRCQKISLKPITASEIEKILITDYDIDSQKATVLSRLSHGCFGWALSAAQDEKILEDYFEKKKPCSGSNGGKPAGTFQLCRHISTQFSRDRASVYGIMDVWLDIWQDLLLLKTELPDSVNNIDIAGQLKQWAATIGLNAIRDSIQAIQEAKIQLALNANARLVLEVMMLDIPVMAGNTVKR